MIKQNSTSPIVMLTCRLSPQPVGRKLGTSEMARLGFRKAGFFSTAELEQRQLAQENVGTDLKLELSFSIALYSSFWAWCPVSFA